MILWGLYLSTLVITDSFSRKSLATSLIQKCAFLGQLFVNYKENFYVTDCIVISRMKKKHIFIVFYIFQMMATRMKLMAPVNCKIIIVRLRPSRNMVTINLNANGLSAVSKALKYNTEHTIRYLFNALFCPHDLTHGFSGLSEGLHLICELELQAPGS